MTRVRLGLEASLPVHLGGAHPAPEPGGRRPARLGDAETGFGLDLGAGLALSGSGLQAEMSGRGLLALPAADRFRERGFSGSLSWRQHPSSDRGAALSLTQGVGDPSSGGADALLARPTLAGLAPDAAAGDDADLASRRLELKLGYGLGRLRRPLHPHPRAGRRLSDGGRDYRLALRLTPAGGSGPFQLAFEAARRETATDPEHEARVHAQRAVPSRKLTGNARDRKALPRRRRHSEALPLLRTDAYPRARSDPIPHRAGDRGVRRGR